MQSTKASVSSATTLTVAYPFWEAYFAYSKILVSASSCDDSRSSTRTVPTRLILQHCSPHATNSVLSCLQLWPCSRSTSVLLWWTQSASSCFEPLKEASPLSDLMTCWNISEPHTRPWALYSRVLHPWWKILDRRQRWHQLCYYCLLLVVSSLVTAWQHHGIFVGYHPASVQCSHHELCKPTFPWIFQLVEHSPQLCAWALPYLFCKVTNLLQPNY